MNQMKGNPVKSTTRLLPVLVAVLALMYSATAFAAAPGIKGNRFSLVAAPAYITQPDGAMIYSWGYGCSSSATGVSFAPDMPNKNCPTMQVPGPTLIVTEGDSVFVTLDNELPSPAGNTSILFPGFNVTAAAASTQPSGCTQTTAATQAPQGLLAVEAAHGCAVTYTFTASTPGTRAYYSGTQSDLQVEMGMYGVVIVLPKTIPANCDSGVAKQNANAQAAWGETDFRLAHAAYDHPASCYDREYLFQFSEIDPVIHQQAQEQIAALGSCVAGAAGCSLNVATEPYHPAYYMINGRSMPDDMDPNYSSQYPHQPYNGDPHLHPGEQVLLRVVGQGRWQHPFHEHANHVRVLGRDGNMILSPGMITYEGTGAPAPALAGPALFTTTTTPGQAMDGIFYYTGRGLNWDMYGHNPSSGDPLAKLTCTPDANGYNTGVDATGSIVNSTVASAINYYEWCQDHNKPMQAHPFGDVNAGGPVTLPDPNILTNGAWYPGSPYLGVNATTRSVGATGTTPPAGTVVNGPVGEAGFAFMWHSHNEREITTNNIFPGGMMMMMIVDSREYVIDETK